MKFIVTGASGFVGKMVVPRLEEQGHELLLIGRSRDKLAAEFPGRAMATYEDILELGQGADVLLHLATINSDSVAPEAEVFAVNVDLLVETTKRAREAGVCHIVNLSSVHALDPNNESAYARSKRAGHEALQAMGDLTVTTLYLPLVYDKAWNGKLALLNRLPGPLARSAFAVLASLKPTCSVDKITAFLDQPRPGDIILFDDKSENLFYRVVRRAIDLAFALAVVLLLGWALVLVWIAIRFDSKGPGIFTQTRVGKDERSFTCYKFRTMKQGTRHVGTHEMTADSITRLGAFLRRSKLDELPQVINIFRNEISLIGPRPCLPNQSELIKARRALNVFDLKPGISGLAQVNSVDMSNPERLAHWDWRYAGLRGLVLDLKIVSATALGNGQGDKVVNK